LQVRNSAVVSLMNITALKHTCHQKQTEEDKEE